VIERLEDRVSPDALAWLQDAAAEIAQEPAKIATRVPAAGRDVPAEVWTVIDRHSPAEEIAAIEAELDSPYEDRRAAARRTNEERA
jgi:hypothetical protein